MKEVMAGVDEATVIKFEDGHKQETNNQTRLVINTGNVFIHLLHLLCWVRFYVALNHLLSTSSNLDDRY